MISTFILNKLRCANASINHTTKKVFNTATFTSSCISNVAGGGGRGDAISLTSMSIAAISTVAGLSLVVDNDDDDADADAGGRPNENIIRSVDSNFNTGNFDYCKCEEGHEDGEQGGDANKTKTTEMFLNYFPKSQLFQPKRPYPAWDDDWDGREQQYKKQEKSRAGTTRHLILIR